MLGALLGGLGSSAMQSSLFNPGALFDFGLNYASAKAGRDWAGHQADKAMEFSERMASTQHQREVADLRAAGLNPVLSASKGGPGAAAPGGVVAGAPQMPELSSASSNLSMRRLVDQQLKTESERTRGERHRSDEAEDRQKITEFERRVLGALEHNFKSNGVSTEAERRLEEAKAGSTAARIERELDEASGELLRSLRRLGISGGSAAQILNLLRERGARSVPRR